MNSRKSMNNEPALLDKNTQIADAPESFSARQQLKVATDDVRALIDSEINYYKVRLSYTRKVAKWTGVYLLISACALFGSVVACILGALLIASNFWGPIWGAVSVIATSVIVLIICKKSIS